MEVGGVMNINIKCAVAIVEVSDYLNTNTFEASAENVNILTSKWQLRWNARGKG